MPKRWKSFDGRFTTVETPQTRHAARLKDLYNALVSSDYLAREERMEILSSLLSIVQVHSLLYKITFHSYDKLNTVRSVRQEVTVLMFTW